MCGDKPWAQADRKTVSMLYLSLGTEGRRIICSKNPQLKMDILTTVELWNIMESTFIRQRNIAFDRYMLLTAKQSKGESIEHFFGKLKELSENCDLGNQEDTLIRDLFIANMQYPEIQRELLRETLEPAQALRLAINMELGQRNQLQISNTQTASHINAIIPQRSFRQSNQRPTTSNSTRQSSQLCRNCGLTWSANHKDKCIARGKTCNNCGLRNHFSRICRKPKSSSNNSTRSNINSIEETTTDQFVNAIQNADYNPQCESDYDSSDDNMVASIASKSIQIEPKNTTLQIGNSQVGLLSDSGNVCSIFNETLATEIVDNSTFERWLTTAPAQELKTLAKEPITVFGMIQAPIESNGWRIEDAEFVVVKDGLKPLIGRDLIEALGISITQSLCSNEGSMVKTITTQCPLKTCIGNQLPQLISRIGRSKIHIVKSKFHKKFQPKHQKGRRVPINLQDRVNSEIKKLLEEGHIEKLNNCSDQYLISPIVITVRRDQTIKLALDSKILNKSIHKNKYQMPHIETLTDSISQIITDYKTEPADNIYFSKQSVNAIQDTNYNPQCGSDYDSLDDNMVASIASTTVQIEPKNTILQTENMKVGLLIDSGSVCSILDEILATEVINNSTHVRWLTTAPAQKLKTFAYEPIAVIGLMQAPVQNNGWWIADAEFVVVRDGLKPLIGRDLFEVLGTSITQTLCSDEGSMVNTITPQCPFKTYIASQFPQLISRIGRSKIYIAKSKLHKNFQPKRQKVRRVPINLQERVHNEIKKLLEEEHINKHKNCCDQFFISPVVIRVKRDQTIK